MDAYLFLKYTHVISATLLFGTGFGTAFHGWMAHRSGDRPTIAVVSRNVVLADWLFTASAVLVQPATGFAMAWQAGIPLTSSWLLLSLGLYLLTGACWLPVVWLQIRMHAFALEAVQASEPLPPRYLAFASGLKRRFAGTSGSMLGAPALRGGRRPRQRRDHGQPACDPAYLVRSRP